MESSLDSKLVLGSDGSYSLYNDEYKQSYHAKSLGAFTETMSKHVLPALEFVKNEGLKEVKILDICFGLGFNAFLSMMYFQKVLIYSPEKSSLKDIYNFPYPKDLDSLKPNIALKKLSLESTFRYKDNVLHFYEGDAINYIQSFEDGFFDIIYQDAFSKEHNAELWSKEYFSLLFAKTKPRCLVTTYAKAREVIQNVESAGFKAKKYELGSLFYK
ncbi:hypothetical protein BKH43_07160 [Helicobacter sp. 13S00401-1]|uniref:MnmC family methyltransferase n=1 Tax=Helicobacter sp. 13S00401-1 TaxID=1905758 RepID=UPI000BA50699|nr:MnmC family methyltransferase [Helicobacter sp. 13S00401-1]PAF49296.1 hypothetical protein BKH43_07160 [Helicobacter sp. 13S00401-1]